VDQELCKKLSGQATDDGCTAIVVLILGDMLFVAWAGDSRAVVCTGTDQQAVPLSVDHKASNRKVRDGWLGLYGETVCIHKAEQRKLDSVMQERRRVELAGGDVVLFGGWRVGPAGTKQWLEDARKARLDGQEVSLLAQPPMLAVTRAFGDRTFKDPDMLVTAEPELGVHTITSRDSFIILACDGLWDVLSNDEAVEFVYNALRAGRSLEMTTKSLVAKAYHKGSADNISVVLATFVS